MHEAAEEKNESTHARGHAHARRGVVSVTEAGDKARRAELLSAQHPRPVCRVRTEAVQSTHTGRHPRSGTTLPGRVFTIKDHLLADYSILECVGISIKLHKIKLLIVQEGPSYY